MSILNKKTQESLITELNGKKYINNTLKLIKTKDYNLYFINKKYLCQKDSKYVINVFDYIFKKNFEVTEGEKNIVIKTKDYCKIETIYNQLLEFNVVYTFKYIQENKEKF